jgi:hypothetical protein
LRTAAVTAIVFVVFLFSGLLKSFAEIFNLLRRTVLDLVCNLDRRIGQTRHDRPDAVAIRIVFVQFALQRTEIAKNTFCTGIFNVLKGFFPPLDFLDGSIRSHLGHALTEGVDCSSKPRRHGNPPFFLGTDESSFPDLRKTVALWMFPPCPNFQSPDNSRLKNFSVLEVVRGQAKYSRSMMSVGLTDGPTLQRR